MRNDAVKYLLGPKRRHTLGWYFGYPTCCIESFSIFMSGKKAGLFLREPIQTLASRRIGQFGCIPCPDCANKIMHDKGFAESYVAGIDKRRHCKLPRTERNNRGNAHLERVFRRKLRRSLLPNYLLTGYHHG